ncbi:MAG: VOC family protein [Alphaproteobacteria bacterium]|nr:VOC family protein [Alphaproteobacteria bacterium]
MSQSLFHLAFPVKDLKKTRFFYEELLGCPVGRTSDLWIDFNFFGHQITAHLNLEELNHVKSNPVDGDDVPVRHFGVILEWKEWHKWADKLAQANIKFLIEPHIRFKNQIGEQATLFFADPSGNVLEFKSFQEKDQIFAHI